MVQVEYDGCIYSFNRRHEGAGLWFGERKISRSEHGLYPGNCVLAPMSVQGTLCKIAIASGYSKAQVSMKAPTPPKPEKAERATRAPKKKSNSISIF